LSSAGDLTGALIADKYQLLRLIGRGGMGAVYEARNVATLKRCAVKVLLSPELAGDGEMVKRFFREAKASGLIESEHVVAAFDSGIDAAERVYYVMECLQGEDLEQTLGRLGLINPQAAIKIILQAATGLASAHRLGIVHRDVKPANLFLSVGPGDEVKVKILDFGVAKVKMEVFNESNNSLTQSGSLLGTPLYMSPEQLRRASAIDESADVWSLGVVLFECLTGELPWGACDGIGELVAAILTLRLPLIQDLAPWVRPDLAEVVQRTLSRDPNQRLCSATLLCEALSKLVNGDARLYLDEISVPDDQERRSLAPRVSIPDTVMIGPTPHSSTPVVSTAVPRPARRSAPLPVVFGALVVAGAAAWTATQRPAAHPVSQAAPVAAPSPSAPSTPLQQRTAPSPIASARTDAPLSKRFLLEVNPAAAHIAVDGVSAQVLAGRVAIEGAVGSVHTVRVTFAGRNSEQRIAITHDGLVPSRVNMPPVAQPPEHVNPPENSAPKTDDKATISAAPTAAPSAGLSSIFE
jgi:eukaryotic-like serine/threonine-protein kinase